MSETTQRERLDRALRDRLEALAAEADELVDECLSYRSIGEDNPHVVLVQRGVAAARNLLAAADLISDGGRPYVQCCDAPHYVIRCLNCMGYQAAPVQHTTEETSHER